MPPLMTLILLFPSGRMLSTASASTVSGLGVAIVTSTMSASSSSAKLSILKSCPRPTMLLWLMASLTARCAALVSSFPCRSIPVPTSTRYFL